MRQAFRDASSRMSSFTRCCTSNISHAFVTPASWFTHPHSKQRRKGFASSKRRGNGSRQFEWQHDSTEHVDNPVEKVPRTPYELTQPMSHINFHLFCTQLYKSVACVEMC